MSQNSANRIRILDTITANQIAAGEVVERPSSVVKELVENAIDAGATKIEIKIKDAGTTLISVSDNGCGMSPDDLVRCLMPHATSKLNKISDLDTLNTLGFRGEALAAISAVSKLTIISKPEAQEYAFSIRSEGGKQQLPQETAAKNGTLIMVEDLFFNTPARKKFLRSASTETASISDYLSHLALSHPHIAFQYNIDGRIALKTKGNGNLRDAVIAVYGPNLLENLSDVKSIQPFVINGLISKPQFTKPNRNQYNFFVNGRWIQSKELTRCVDEVYHTIIPQGRYPFVMLFLQVAPASIDVNIHPAKLEIKFRDSESVCNAVKAALQNALFSKKSTQTVWQEPLNNATKASVKRNISSQLSENENKTIQNEQKLFGKTNSFHEALKADAVDINRIFSGKTISRTNNKIEKILPVQQADILQQKDAVKAIVPETQNNEYERDFKYSELQLLGQAAGTYIIASGEDALYITDQHAAHERLLFEKFKNEAKLYGNGSAPLLIPVNIDFTHQEVLLLSKYIVQLTDMGFIIEHFGDNTFVLRAVPLWYEGSAPDYLIQDLLAEFVEGGKPDKNSVLEEMLFMAACKAAIKGNQYQDNAQINALFDELDKNPQLITCPHGRPITIKISYSELQKRFYRSGI